MAGFLRLSCDLARIVRVTFGVDRSERFNALLGHFIAHTPNSQQVTGIVGLGFNLLSDLADKGHDVTVIEQILVLPYRAIDFSLLKTVPRLLAKKARISNSLGVSETGAPDTLTVREARSMARPSITMGSAAALVCEPATASSMAVSLPDAISANTGASSRAAALPDENSALLSSAASAGVIAMLVLLVRIEPP